MNNKNSKFIKLRLKKGKKLFQKKKDKNKLQNKKKLRKRKNLN